MLRKLLLASVFALSGNAALADGSAMSQAPAVNPLLTPFVDFNNTTAAASTTYLAAIRTFVSYATKFKVTFSSTVAATGSIQGCIDSGCANPLTVATTSIAAASQQSVSIDVTFPYYRISIVTGTTAGNITAVSAFAAS